MRTTMQKGFKTEVLKPSKASLRFETKASG